MSNTIKLSNNVFDLSILGKKDFIEMIDNFINTASQLNFFDFQDVNEDKYERILREIGIVSDKQDLEIVKNILSKKQWEKLTSVLNYLILKGSSYPQELKKYFLIYRDEQVQKERESNKPTIVDLFCGAGGLSLGFSQTGFKIVFANDIEQAALRTYSFNHPEISAGYITMGGIENISHNIKEYVTESVDVLIGGPPCQGFSNANRQRIIDDPRNVLYKYYVESVQGLKPKFFVMENVKGMKKVANQVVEDFNRLSDVQYDISFTVFNAKEFGVPQNRERLIYIGVRSDIAKNKSISPDEIINLILEKRVDNEVPLIEAIKDLRELKANNTKNSTEIDSEEFGKKIEINNRKSPTNYVSRINRLDNRLTFNHKARYNNDRDIEIYRRLLPGEDSSAESIQDIMPYHSRKDIFKDKYYKLVPNKVCKTITAHMKFDCNMYIHPYQARGLTPREAARIQSYPDDYFFLGAYTKTYMQIGNSVPPLLSKMIAGVIIQFI